MKILMVNKFLYPRGGSESYMLKLADEMKAKDSCFLDTVSDDTARISEYISEGINNLSFFDIDDLFIGKNAAYSTSEVHFAQKLKGGSYERYVDIRRCRIARILPLPLKERALCKPMLRRFTPAAKSPSNSPAVLVSGLHSTVISASGVS